MSMAATTAGATKPWQAASLRRGLHGIAWAIALISIGDGLYRLDHAATARTPRALPVSRPADITVAALPPTQNVPGTWRWRLQVRHAANATPRLRLHLWQSKGGNRFDDHLLIPLEVATASDEETFDVSLSPGTSRASTEYLGDPAGQLYLCDTLAVTVASSAPGAKPETLLVPNPFRADAQNGAAAESLPPIVVKDGARTSVTETYSDQQTKQTVDLALTARPGWGVTGAATLEFDAFGS